MISEIRLPDRARDRAIAVPNRPGPTIAIDGRFTARLSQEWEIWGPMGGYIASTALRAAGATSPFDRPASFFCHYLGVARFEAVDIEPNGAAVAPTIRFRPGVESVWEYRTTPALISFAAFRLNLTLERQSI